MRTKLVVALIIMAVAGAAFADGAAVFTGKCAMCHGKGGAGDTGMGKSLALKDLGSADVQKASDAELTKLIADGKGKMPAYKGKLSDEEIKSVVCFIRTLKK
jgi:mono/diheme cytochrome c family protein